MQKAPGDPQGLQLVKIAPPGCILISCRCFEVGEHLDQVTKLDVAGGVHVGAAAAEHVKQGVNISVVDSTIVVDVTGCFNAGQNLAGSPQMFELSVPMRYSGK